MIGEGEGQNGKRVGSGVALDGQPERLHAKCLASAYSGLLHSYVGERTSNNPGCMLVTASTVTAFIEGDTPYTQTRDLPVQRKLRDMEIPRVLITNSEVHAYILLLLPVSNILDVSMYAFC